MKNKPKIMNPNRIKLAACLSSLLALTVIASARHSDGDNNKNSGQNAPQPQPQQVQPQQVQPQPQPQMQPQRQPQQIQPQMQPQRQPQQVQPPRQPQQIQPQRPPKQIQPPIQRPPSKPTPAIEKPPAATKTGAIKSLSGETNKSPTEGTGRRGPKPDSKPNDSGGTPNKPDASTIRDSGSGKMGNDGSKKNPPISGRVNGNDPNPPGSTHPGESVARKPLGGGGSTANVKDLLPPKIVKNQDGSVTTTRSSKDGKPVEKVLELPNGGRRIERYSGNNLSERIDANKDGTQYKTNYTGVKPTREEVTHKDGSRVISTHQIARDGQTRITQTIEHNAQGRAISKTVTVKQPVVLTKKTAFDGTRIVKNYDHGRFGFVYHPDHAQRAPFQAFHRDSYWHNPAGMMYQHPFHYVWGWDRYPWYRSHAFYFPIYEVYPTPVYWVTDWMVASYIADDYAAEPMIAEEPSTVRTAPAPNATPISNELKEDLRVQVENTIAEEDRQMDSKADQPVTYDLAKALADPKHIYPVSGRLNVTAAADENLSVTVSDGDLLKIEPGQGDILADATENTFVTMRVMTSKGEEGEVRAGTLISVPLRSLQDFDSEFRSRIDQGLAEAAVNKDIFKSGAE